MTQKELELLGSVTSLLLKYHEFLGLLYPLPSEMAEYLEPNSPRPSLEKLKAWKTRLREIDQRHSELVLAFESLRQSLGLEGGGNA